MAVDHLDNPRLRRGTRNFEDQSAAPSRDPWGTNEDSSAREQENRAMSLNAQDQAQTAPSPDIERIMNDFASLKRDFADLVGHVRNGAVNGAGDATDAIRSSLGALGGKTRGVYDELAAQGGRSAQALGRHVEERPLMSLLVAFGVGMLASRLLSR